MKQQVLQTALDNALELTRKAQFQFQLGFLMMSVGREDEMKAALMKADHTLMLAIQTMEKEATNG